MDKITLDMLKILEIDPSTLGMEEVQEDGVSRLVVSFSKEMGENPNFDIEPLLASLSADDMAKQYGGNPWAWVQFDEARYMVANKFTQGVYTGGYWQRYTIECGSSGGESISVPVLYTEMDEIEVVNEMNFSSEVCDQYVFATFVTIMAMTIIAEIWYEKSESEGLHWYGMRNQVVNAYRYGNVYRVTTDEKIAKLIRLLD